MTDMMIQLETGSFLCQHCASEAPVNLLTKDDRSLPLSDRANDLITRAAIALDVVRGWGHVWRSQNGGPPTVGQPVVAFFYCSKCKASFDSQPESKGVVHEA